MASSLSLVSFQLNCTQSFNGLPCLQGVRLQAKALSSACSLRPPNSRTLISTTSPSATISTNYAGIGSWGSRAIGFVVPVKPGWRRGAPDDAARGRAVLDREWLVARGGCCILLSPATPTTTSSINRHSTKANKPACLSAGKSFNSARNKRIAELRNMRSSRS